MSTSKRPFLLAATLYGVPAVGLGVFFADAYRLLPWLHDDAFHCFEVARNWALHGRVTFDSISPTNGFHPLWQWLVTPFFLVLRSDFGPIRAVLVFDAHRERFGVEPICRVMQAAPFTRECTPVPRS